MKKIKNGLILAGGDGDRFWPLENKVLFNFLGKPLILYQIEQLQRYVEKITVVAAKDNAITIKRLIDNSGFSSNIQVIIQKDIPGQAGAILSVKNLIKGEVIIINANDLIDLSILSKIDDLLRKNQILLFGKKFNEYFSGGYFKFDNQGKIIEVIEKPEKDKIPSNIVKLVIDYYFDIDELIKALEKIKTNTDNHYELAINYLLKTDLKRDYLLYENYWQSLKYSWDVLKMIKLLLETIKEKNIAKTAKISKKAKIIGPVIIDEGVVIGDFVKILGPVYIGENTIIGDYSLIRQSQIGADCLVGSYNEVARSYIGNKVFLHRNYVGDSIIADEVMMGAQAATANLRFDEGIVKSYFQDKKIETGLNKMGAIIGKQSKIGVNTTILPGIKIGKKCWVAPSEIVRYDLEDKTYLNKDEEKINLKT